MKRIQKQYHLVRRTWAEILLLLAFTLLTFPRAAAQAPLTELRLLAWSVDGLFLVGVTPGQIVALPGGSIQQSQLIWRLPAGGGPPQRLAEGLDPQLSPDGQRVLFTRLDDREPWAIDLETGHLQPSDAGAASPLTAAVAGDPAGRLYLSPDGSKRAILVNEFFTASLWVGEANAPAELVLSGEGEVFSDLSWRPDGQALALIRTPLGSQTDIAGELWRIDLATNTPTRLSQNNVADRSPVWTPDGTRLAVVRNGQRVIVPADRLQVEPFAQVEQASLRAAAPVEAAAQLTPPATIRVIHHASNTCRTVPVGQIDTIPFEEYVKRVVPYEVYPSWPAETLKAQAVAARTYGWDKVLQNPGGAYHVTDWVNHQYMCDTTVASTNQAVDATAGEYLAYNGQIITAMFSAENASPTKDNAFAAYLRAIDDPVSFGQTRNGHGYGMGQWGAQRWAGQHDWSYQAILLHYYTDVSLEEAGSAVDSAPPNVALAAPWSDGYVRSSRLRLLVNASDDSGQISQTNIYLSTPSETNLLVSQANPPHRAAYVVDVSAWADEALLNNTLVLTADAFDGSGKRSISPPVVIGLDRVAPTGLLTTATMLVGTTLITDSPVISLTLTASDAVAGASHLAMGRADWNWEGEDLTRELVGGQPVGQVVADTDALNGSALRATTAGDPSGTWTGPATTLPAPQSYRAYVRLKVGEHTNPAEVVRLEVIDTAGGDLIGLHTLRGTDFKATNVYEEFHIDFDRSTVVCDSLGEPVTFRLLFQDTADLSVDRLIVVEVPGPITTAPTYSHAHVRLKVIDAAGNVSNDLLVLPGPTGTDRLFLPLILKPGSDCTS